MNFKILPCIREVANVTLTFVSGALFFHATHGLDVPNTFAKLYGNPFMHCMALRDKNTKRDGQTDRHSYGSGLWAISIVLFCFFMG